CLGGLDDPRDIRGGDFLVLHGHHPAGIEAADMAAGDAGINVADLAVGHQLRFFKRSLDGIDGGLDVDDHALAHAARLVLAQAQHFEAPFRQDFGDHGHHLAGADIQGDDEVLDVTGHGVNASSKKWMEISVWLALPAAAPGPGRTRWGSAGRPASRGGLPAGWSPPARPARSAGCAPRTATRQAARAGRARPRPGRAPGPAPCRWTAWPSRHSARSGPVRARAGPAARTSGPARRSAAPPVLPNL